MQVLANSRGSRGKSLPKVTTKHMKCYLFLQRYLARLPKYSKGAAYCPYIHNIRLLNVAITTKWLPKKLLDTNFIFMSSNNQLKQFLDTFQLTHMHLIIFSLVPTYSPVLFLALVVVIIPICIYIYVKSRRIRLSPCLQGV